MDTQKHVVILGGGFTGLSAAYYCRKRGHRVTLLERSEDLGGLAMGFKKKNWEWPLEKAYHHLFASDTAILSFANEIGFDGIYFTSPKTDSLYRDAKGNQKIYSVDSPINLLRFPLLSPFDRLKTGLALATMKFLPLFPVYSRISARLFVERFVGRKVWRIFFEQLFRKKFGKYAGKIAASFLWGRVRSRTKKLGYIRGGFQTLVLFTENKLREMGVEVVKGAEVKKIVMKDGKYTISIGDEKKKVICTDIISTLPSPILCTLGRALFPASYITNLEKLEYLSALVVILESNAPYLDKTYWLNICDPKNPLMLVGQHTNMVSSDHYGGNHLCYVGFYTEYDSDLMKMTDTEVVEYILPYLDPIHSDPTRKILGTNVFRFGHAQPIWHKAYLKYKPTFHSPLKNFYIANLDMTYPYDRGTNHAVRLGREVAEIVR